MRYFARTDDLQLPEYRAFNGRRRAAFDALWSDPFAFYAVGSATAGIILDWSTDSIPLNDRFELHFPGVKVISASGPAAGVRSKVEGVGLLNAVVCRNTFDKASLEDSSAVLMCLADMLQPGGRLILTSRGMAEDVFQSLLRVVASVGLVPHSRTPDRVEPTDNGRSRAFGVSLLKPPASEELAPRIVVGLLSWNLKRIVLESVQALLSEAALLRRVGYDAHVCVVDNGSSDGTPAALQDVSATAAVPHEFIYNKSNLGISAGRNQIIDTALSLRAESIIFVDGDVQVIPGSSLALTRCLQSSGDPRLGCVGILQSRHTPKRADASPVLFGIPIDATRPQLTAACTHYGIFRVSMFEEGIRFDTDGPFAGPGWGLEDTDLMYQMAARGYITRAFEGVRFLHRARGSSIPLLLGQKIDARGIFNRRKAYLLRKWSETPIVANGPLRALRGHAMRVSG